MLSKATFEAFKAWYETKSLATNDFLKYSYDQQFLENVSEWNCSYGINGSPDCKGGSRNNLNASKHKFEKTLSIDKYKANFKLPGRKKTYLDGVDKFAKAEE